jgi:hypothetical protein
VKRHIYLELQELRRDFIAKGMLEAVGVLDERFPDIKNDIVRIIRIHEMPNSAPIRRYLHRWERNGIKQWTKEKSRGVMRMTRERGETIMATFEVEPYIRYELEIAKAEPLLDPPPQPQPLIPRMTLGRRKEFA